MYKRQDLKYNVGLLIESSEFDVDLAARPEAMAMAIVIAILSAVMIFFYLRYTRKRIRG